MLNQELVKRINVLADKLIEGTSNALENVEFDQLYKQLRFDKKNSLEESY